ncbi:MAG: ZIP family metal transporter [Clostridia bacterium]|nr:ZIP family metal transporter [Clostridia bacterium]
MPFLGTALGAACVFFLHREPDARLRRGLTGFAAGVMVAASVWSLLLPAYDLSAGLGAWSFLPPAAGFWAGVLFLLLLDLFIPHLHFGSERAQGPRSRLKKTSMLTLAVTLHNLPEGMAVGVVLAGLLSGEAGVSEAGAFALALGIALQNVPEGTILSLPLRERGVGRAFFVGTMSGVVEPIGAVLTLALARQVSAVLPYLLAFAAGAMLYVVVEELIPEAAEDGPSNVGVLCFAVGFSIMMVMDTVLG